MRAKKLTFLAGAGVLAGVSAVTSKPPKKLKVASTTWRGLIDSHEKFSHDSIDHLGYDWERVGNPNVKPKHPFKVYIPRSTEDVVEAVKEVKELGQKLTVRSKGHSSNDLVLSDHGAVLLMQAMDNIIGIDEDGLTATVQGGAISALVDDHLAPMGLGLPVIGDHKDITVGGFASVGGISPGSHRFGMFIDNVLAIEFVDWDGNVKWCSKEENSEDYYTLLAGLGKHGVMTQLKLRLIKIDKYTTIWFNDQTHYRTMDDFIAGTKPIIEEPGDAMMERGVWADFALPGGKNFRLGQFSDLQGDRPDRGPQGAQQRLLRRPALDGPRRRQPAGQARPRAQVRLDHRASWRAPSTRRSRTSSSSPTRSSTRRSATRRGC